MTGVAGTPDIFEDLLRLGELDGHLVFGSMNRGGLTGSSWELDDRFTAFDTPTIAAMGLDGGKMLLRIDDTDPGSNQTMVACAGAVGALAAERLVAMVEPLPAAIGWEGQGGGRPRSARRGGGRGICPRPGFGLHMAQAPGTGRAGTGAGSDQPALSPSRR